MINRLLFFDKSKLLYLGLAQFALALCLFSSEFPFYWDNIVQLSLPATYYYNNGFGDFILPSSFATGHPVLLPAYLSLCWTVFGKSLIVSHLAFLPFTLCFLFQIPLLLKNLGLTKQVDVLLITLFVLLETTILSQLSLITFEITHLFALLLAINAIIKNRSLLLTLALLVMCFSSMRGSISALALGVFYLVEVLMNSRKLFFKKMMPFIMSAFAILLYYGYFYYKNGWIINNPYTFGGCGEVGSVFYMFKKIAVIGWLFFDKGRLLVGGIFVFQLFMLLKYREKYNNYPLLVKIVLFQLLAFSGFTIYSENSLGPRYFMPIYLLVNIFSLLFVFAQPIGRKIKLLLFSVVLLFFGHLWVYPPTVAQSWDCTVLHWHYFSLCDSMDNYVKSSGIDYTKVTSFFPNTYNRRFTKLVEDTTIQYATYAGLKKGEYVIYSNTYNPNDAIINSLNNKRLFTEVKCYKSPFLFVKLLKVND